MYVYIILNTQLVILEHGNFRIFTKYFIPSRFRKIIGHRQTTCALAVSRCKRGKLALLTIILSLHRYNGGTFLCFGRSIIRYSRFHSLQIHFANFHCLQYSVLRVKLR